MQGVDSCRVLCCSVWLLVRAALSTKNLITNRFILQNSILSLLPTVSTTTTVQQQYNNNSTQSWPLSHMLFLHSKSIMMQARWLLLKVPWQSHISTRLARALPNSQRNSHERSLRFATATLRTYHPRNTASPSRPRSPLSCPVSPPLLPLVCMQPCPAVGTRLDS